LLEPKQDPKAFFSTVTFAGGYDRALLAVANGQADIAAVSDYTMIGEKADVYLPAEQRAKLRILEHTPGVPTHGVCIRTDLPEDFQKAMQAALLRLSQQSPELLADVYGASSFVAVDDSHTSAAQAAINRTGLSTREMVQ
jgi:phosphonate transport system substrate-binding protein